MLEIFPTSCKMFTNCQCGRNNITIGLHYSLLVLLFSANLLRKHGRTKSLIFVNFSFCKFYYAVYEVSFKFFNLGTVSTNKSTATREASPGRASGGMVWKGGVPPSTL